MGCLSPQAVLKELIMASSVLATWLACGFKQPHDHWPFSDDCTFFATLK